MPQLSKSVAFLIGITCGLAVCGLQAQERDEKVDMEMLEFIGEWEAADGTWVDPMALQQELQNLPQQNSAVYEEKKDESR